MESDKQPGKAAPAAPKGNSAAWLFTGVGAIAVAVICIVLNYLLSNSTAQVDFTASKMHTLAEGTKDLLKDLKSDDAPVTVKIFVSPDEDMGNANWLVQLRDLRSMLELFRSYAGKNLKIEMRRPSPDTDDEDAAEQAGVRPQQVGPNREVFFGVAATCLDKTSTVQFIPAIEPPLLEYKLIRAIYRVRPAPKKVVGLMTPLEMDGGMSFMGGTPPTYFYRELSEDYDVVKVDVTANEIKTNEYTDFTLNYGDGTFTRQEYKGGSPGTKGNGTFTVAGGEKDKEKADANAKGVNGGKTPEKIEAVSYILTEGGNANVLTFNGPSTGEQSGSGKKEGFAYTFTKSDDTKATVQIRKGVDVLVIIHPAGISDEAQWAVDQFILKGGKVVALVDSYSFVAASTRQQQNPFMRQQQQQGIDPSSSLQKLFAAWGYTYDNNNVVADINYKAAGYENPLIISPPVAAINHKELVSKDLNNFIFAFPGGLTGKAGFGLKEETLIETSKDTQLVSAANLNQQAIAKVINNFASSGDKRILAVKVTGKFPTAFPQGKPDAPPPPPPGGQGGGMPFGAGGFGPQGAQGPNGEPAPAQPAAAPAPPENKPAADAAAPAPATATPAADAPKPPDAPATTPPPATATTPPVSVTTPPVSVTTPPVSATTPPVSATTPPVSATTPPVSATTPPVSATTPPVEVPPATAPPGTPPGIPAIPAPPAKPKVPSLAQGEAEATVYLIADSDLISDQVNLQGGRGQLAEPTNSNLPLVFNIIDELAGNTGLIQARSRTSSERPFTKLNEILEQTNKDLRVEQKKIEDDIAKWREELTTKGSKKNPNSQVIFISPAELAELQKKIDDGEAKKRSLRKKFRSNIDSKFAWIQGLNILGVPLLIILSGLTVVLIRRSNTAAR